MPKNNGDMVDFPQTKSYIMIDNNLGRGSFGKTVLLKDKFIDELFVAKKHEPEFPEDKERFFDSFLQEIKIMHKLNHRNIVRIYNYYAYKKDFTGFILMEHIAGKNIESYFVEFLDSGFLLDIGVDDFFLN